jgi:hypothetical protein
MVVCLDAEPLAGLHSVLVRRLAALDNIAAAVRANIDAVREVKQLA